MTFVLRPLEIDDEQQALAAHGTMAAEHFPFLLGHASGEPFANYLRRLEDQRAGRQVPTGWVAATFLVGEVAGQIVGRLSLRHSLPPSWRHTAGHIGFCVLPEHRRKGHASMMLRSALGRASELGLTRILVTCDEPNEASRRVIEKCSGVYEDTYRGEEAPLPVLRYWIDIETP